MLHKTIQEEDVPALGIGTWQVRGKACYDSVSHALSLGCRHVDTAQMYKNEDEVGRAIQDSEVDRNDIFLTTKVWPDYLDPESIRRTVGNSLNRLATDYVDLLLIHWPSDEVPLEDSLGEFIALQEEGKTRHIGVSNFTPDLVERALDYTPIFCNQVEYHPFLSQQELLQMAREHDFLLTAYSPLARGRVLDDELLQDIADTHGKNPAQVALRWLIQQENVAAIPKAEKKEHREMNFDIFDFELSQEEMDHIFDLARGQRLLNPQGLAPDW